jgi:hypothetical protein
MSKLEQLLAQRASMRQYNKFVNEAEKAGYEKAL